MLDISLPVFKFVLVSYSDYNFLIAEHWTSLLEDCVALQTFKSDIRYNFRFFFKLANIDFKQYLLEEEKMFLLMFCLGFPYKYQDFLTV